MAEEKKDGFVKWFSEVGIDDVPVVGGKNAALGEMYSNLVPLGVNVPDGFALTADAYRHFFKQTGLDEKIKQILSDLNTKDIRNLQIRGKKVREAILKKTLPQDLQEVIIESYKKLGEKYGKNNDVAVRSSATAEDLPGASFAGQQETFLNVRGDSNLILKIRECWASLFTERAIFYRHENKYDHFRVGIAVPVQRMVESDTSGVMFTIDPVTNDKSKIIIESSFSISSRLL